MFERVEARRIVVVLTPYIQVGGPGVGFIGGKLDKGVGDDSPLGNRDALEAYAHTLGIAAFLTQLQVRAVPVRGTRADPFLMGVIIMVDADIQRAGGCRRDRGLS